MQEEDASLLWGQAMFAAGPADGTIAPPDGPPLGIAFCDQLIHGRDLARATGQDETMPPDLAAVALQLLDGRITDDRVVGDRDRRSEVFAGSA